MKKIIFAVALMLTMFSSFAEAFTPPKTVTVTIGYGPGSGNEVSFRAVAAHIEKNNPNIRFLIQNKPGADEILGLNDFFTKPADGTNLLVASYAIMATSEIFFPEAMKHNVMDLSLVTTIAKSPLCVIANINSKTNTPRELITRLSNTKEPVNIGLGVTGHALVYEHLLEKSNADRNLVKAVPFKFAADAAQAVAGGHVEFGIVPAAIANAMVKTGKAKFIGITGERRLAQLPDVPLFKDAGMPELLIYGHWVIALPPNTPKEIVKYYQELFVSAINSAEVKEFFDNSLMLTYPAEQNPEGVRKFFTGFRNYWQPYARKINLN